MEGKFSLNSQSLTNKEISIQYTPNTSALQYTYKIIKDNEPIEKITKKGNKSVIITLSESGKYQIEVETILKNKKKEKKISGIYNIDMDKPIIVAKNSVLKMEQLSKEKTVDKDIFKDFIIVRDNRDGNLFNKLDCDFNSVPYDQVGLYNLTCTVSDEAGNIAEQEFKFQILKSTRQQLLLAQIIIGLVLVIAMFFIVRYLKAIYYENKITPYTVKPINQKKIGLLDKVELQFLEVINKISNVFKKSTFLNSYSKRYEKYAPLLPPKINDAMNFVTIKFMVAIFVLIITFFSKTVHFNVLQGYELIIPFLFGFILPNVLYKIKYRLYRNKLENDLLQAIIIMNNAFKSGRSITQAIELVTHELKGPICEEFKKMLLELNFGLSIETVFSRFSKRVDLEEVTYLTASLAILNKTGGNIIQVFSSIEKSLFNKKKLKLEMKSLTGASRMIVSILFLVPFLFIAFILIISPTYFNSLFTSTLGLIFVGIMIIIYLVYIWFVRKIMDVRM